MTGRLPLADGRVALVDDEDLPRVLAGRWWAHRVSRTREEVRGSVQEGERRRRVHLHRFILRIDDKDVKVGHVDQDGLNNQKSNLKILDASALQQNQSAQRVGATGVRNVFSDVSKKGTVRYRVQIFVNRRRHDLGSYRTLDEAEAVATRGRARLMPNSPEAIRGSDRGRLILA